MILINYDGLYNKDYYGEQLFQNHFSDKKLRFKILENATILPHKSVAGTAGFGGIVDANGNYVEESFVHQGITDIYTPTEEIAYSDESVIYFGMLVHIWGHCLTDNLKRVWFLKSEVYKKYFSRLPIVYVPMWKSIIEPFAKILEILEINQDNLHPITRPVKFRQIILPDSSNLESRGGYEFSKEYLETVSQIKNFAKKNFTPFSQKKFYFFYGTNDIGEEAMAEYFKTKNYELIQPEKLSFEEQLNILANCENFASTLGSISHNSIFLKEGAESIYIPRWAELNQYQFALDTLQDLNVNYIDSSLSICAHHFRGPFCFIVSEQLKKFFGDDFDGYSEQDFENFFIYIRFSANLKISPSAKMQEYYAPVLKNFLDQAKLHDDLAKKYQIVFQ